MKAGTRQGTSDIGQRQTTAVQTVAVDGGCRRWVVVMRSKGRGAFERTCKTGISELTTLHGLRVELPCELPCEPSAHEPNRLLLFATDSSRFKVESF